MYEFETSKMLNNPSFQQQQKTYFEIEIYYYCNSEWSINILYVNSKITLLIFIFQFINIYFI